MKKEYRNRAFTNISEKILEALTKSDNKIKYMEHDLKHGRYDKEQDKYSESREVSFDMLTEKGIQFFQKMRT